MNVDIIIGITPAYELVFVMSRDCVIRTLHYLKLMKFVLCNFAPPEKISLTSLIACSGGSWQKIALYTNL